MKNPFSKPKNKKAPEPPEEYPGQNATRERHKRLRERFAKHGKPTPRKDE